MKILNYVFYYNCWFKVIFSYSVVFIKLIIRFLIRLMVGVLVYLALASIALSASCDVSGPQNSVIAAQRITFIDLVHVLFV